MEANMSRKNQERSDILMFYKIMCENTDEQHSLSMREILRMLETEGYTCSDETILRYIKQLRYVLDVEIEYGKGRNTRYYLAERTITKEEMKLIIDSINASNFIEKKIADKMISKLKGTMSIHEATEMDRNILGVNIAKAENTKILYHVNAIQEALNKGVQIEFDYMKWNKNKKLEQRIERRYTLNPWGLIWANDRYYLYGYDTLEHQGKLKERCYRVDKLDKIELTECVRKGENQFNAFDANTYVSRRMGMFVGEVKLITVKIEESLVGAFIDQYGRNVIVEEEEDKLIVKFHAVDSDILLGWLIGLGGVEVLSPKSTRIKIQKLVEDNLRCYKK